MPSKTNLQKGSSAWSPTSCPYCVEATLKWLESGKKCKWFEEKPLRLRKQVYLSDPYAKPLDMVAFQCLMDLSAKKLHRQDLLEKLWSRKFLAQPSVDLDLRSPAVILDLISLALIIL